MSDIQIIIGVTLIMFAFIMLFVIRAKMTAPTDYSDAVAEKIEETETSPFWTEYIAHQDADFRAGQ